MTEDARGLSSAIRAHLEGLIRNSGLPETEESLDEVTRVWFEKRDMFEGQVKALDMREVQRFTADDPRGALLLTWSGSLLSVGPLGGGRPGRRTEYASIELRTDVPHIATSEEGEFVSDLVVGEAARLRAGPVSRTSALLKIAVCDPAVPVEEQEK